jgi:muramoyltetrapeptide carboxypeptidase
VALVAAAGPLAPGAVERAEARVRAWGWEPVAAPHARGRHGFLAAPDEARLADLNAALRDPAVDAVWLLRGGYGTMRILADVDVAALAARPRPLIGFSDNTALHMAALRAGIVSFHGPHPATETLTEFSAACLRLALRPRAAGTLPFPEGHAAGRAETVRDGAAEGTLVGGNLALLAALAGTPFAPPTRGAILFVEEVGEAAYRVDRMLTQLRLAGLLEGVAGVAVGAFTEAPDAGIPGVPSAREVVEERLARLGVPIAWGFPFGHVPDNWTLPVGVRARLDADEGTLSLLEPATEGDAEPMDDGDDLDAAGDGPLDLP